VKIVFFPQNETHIVNFTPIAKKLNDLGYECFFIDSTSVFHQNLELNKLDPKIKIKPLCLNLERPFYKASFLQKISALLRFKSEIYNFLDKQDIFIAGNDGAFQRILLRQTNKSILIIDGMISNYTFNFRVLLKCFSIQNLKSYLINNGKRLIIPLIYPSLKRLGIEYLSPSLIGISHFSVTFTIGEHSKNVIKQYNRSSEIIASGLPRFTSLYEQKKVLSKRDSRAVYFLTSAFKWHGEYPMDKYQHNDLKLLCSLFLSMDIKDLDLVIKIHPRENKKDYTQYLKFNFVKISSDNLFDELYSNVIYFSNISTSIVETSLLNLPVYSILIHFPYEMYSRSFLGSDQINKILSVAKLKDILNNFRSGYIEESTTDLDELVSSATPKCVDVIVNKILDLNSKT
jgi:hypothetical protein